jgi:hypothetical protein
MKFQSIEVIMIKKYNLSKSACLLLLLWLVPFYSHACRCGSISPSTAYHQADVVLWGKVLTVKGNINTEAGATARISVLKLWKRGVANANEVEVLTRTTCAYDFKIGEEYLLFLNKDSHTDQFTTGICNGNLPIANAKNALKWLNFHSKTINNSP